MGNQKLDYYINGKRKIVDFLVGFIGFPLLYWVSFSLVPSFSFFGSAITWVAVGLFFITLLLLRFFAKNRRFISIGAICFVATVIVLMFGSCFFAWR